MRRALAPLLLLLLPAAASAQERVVLVTNFERLRIDGPFTVEVAPGPPGATVIGDPRVTGGVSVRVDANTLVIDNGLHSWESPVGRQGSTARIRVTVPALRAVFANGGATVRIAELRGDRVDLALNGSGALAIGTMTVGDLGVTATGTGTVTLAGTAMHSRVRLYGATVFDGSAFTTGDAVLVSGSTGDLVVNVRFNAQISATSSGTVRLLGNPKCQVTGQGPIECAAIETRHE